MEDGCCCLYPHQHCTEQNLTHCFEKRGSSSDLAVVTLHAVTDSKYRSLNAEKTGVHEVDGISEKFIVLSRGSNNSLWNY